MFATEPFENSVSDAKLIRALTGGKTPLLTRVFYNCPDCHTLEINNEMRSSDMESLATKALHSIG